MDNLLSYLVTQKWNLVSTLSLKAKDGTYSSHEKLGLFTESQKLLKGLPTGLYSHQMLALEKIFANENVCLATSTASGKSLVFQITAIQRLTENPRRRILAIYPLKALGTEQEARWEKTIQQAGRKFRVGRIDGRTDSRSRKRILRECEIVIMTPDVVHAWLMSNLKERYIRCFLAHLNLMIVDEVHSYTGIFGSNACLMFRRLEHAIRQLVPQPPQIIAASATLYEPEEHLQTLLGQKFFIVGQDKDTSPKQENIIHLVEAPAGDLNTHVAALAEHLAENTDYKFLTFVDSRKQTEKITSFTKQFKEPQCRSVFNNKGILPYRAGYEEHDRQNIEKRLGTNRVSGVISTSALEMGLDIPHLNLCILVGVPRSATSLNQRIGRVGRHQKGTTLIIQNDTPLTRRIFHKPEMLLQMPSQKSSLYLENQFLQYGHVRCLIGQNGEHQQMKVHSTDCHFSTNVNFPKSFLELCRLEEKGQTPSEQLQMRSDLGENPHHQFPLRNLGRQYQVEEKGLYGVEQMGSLSESQLMREAYPGAVYYYRGCSYRVTAINRRKQTVQVRREKRYYTRPITQPTYIQPNFSTQTILQGWRWGEFVAAECQLQINEIVRGYHEQRGSQSITKPYPLDEFPRYTKDSFSRQFSTTGVVLQHPVLENKEVSVPELTKLLLQAFLMILPFERQDVDAGSCKVKYALPPFRNNTQAIVLYDQCYGGLRLTGNILSSEGMPLEAFIRAIEISEEQAILLNQASKEALVTIVNSLHTEQQKSLEFKTDKDCEFEEKIRVLLPGSIGLDAIGREYFRVMDIYYHPRQQAWMYRGKYESSNKVGSICVDQLNPVEGKSELGDYDIELGFEVAS